MVGPTVHIKFLNTEFNFSLFAACTPAGQQVDLVVSQSPGPTGSTSTNVADGHEAAALLWRIVLQVLKHFPGDVWFHGATSSRDRYLQSRRKNKDGILLFIFVQQMTLPIGSIVGICLHALDLEECLYYVKIKLVFRECHSSFVCEIDFVMDRNWHITCWSGPLGGS